MMRSFLIVSGIRTEKMLDDFDNLKLANKVVLTDGLHPNIRFSFPVLGDFYGKDYWHGKILEYPQNGLHRYLECFDYVEFFNSGKIRKRCKKYKK